MTALMVVEKPPSTFDRSETKVNAAVFDRETMFPPYGVSPEHLLPIRSELDEGAEGGQSKKDHRALPTPLSHN